MKSVVKCQITNQKGELLIIKRSKKDSHTGYWETPGGGVESSDKTLVAACIREVFEETGLSVVPKLDKILRLADDTTNELFRVYLFNAVANCENTVTLSPSEHDDFAWVTLDELDQFNVDSWTIKALDS